MAAGELSWAVRPRGIQNCEVVAKQSRRSEEQLPAKRAGGRGGEDSWPRAGLIKPQEKGTGVSQKLED